MKRDVPTPPLKRVLFKDPEDALDEVCVLFERFADRLTLNNLTLAKRYRDCELNLLLEATWGSIDFNILFRKEDRTKTVWDQWPNQEWTLAAAKLEGICRADKHAGRAGVDGYLNSRRCYRDSFTVFVQDIQTMEFPQQATTSLVWFKPTNEPLGSGADALYFGYATGFKRFIGNGEVTTAIRLTAVGTDQIANEMIERGSKVVDNIADNSAQLDWNRFIDAYAMDILSGVRIYIMDKSAFCRVDERIGGLFQVTNVAFGPFNF